MNTRKFSPQYLAGAGLLVIYIGSIVLANWLTTNYGLVPVFPGLVTTAGTVAIGGVIMTRDLLQDAIGRWGILGAIVAGAGLSYATGSSHRIALASGITFLLAESLTWLAYTPLRRSVSWGTFRWAGQVIVPSNALGIVADTLLFLAIAGFPLTWHTVIGQLVGKAYITAAVIICALLIHCALRDPEPEMIP